MMMDRRNKKSLKDVLKEGQVFAPCVWDCFSAHMVEAEGFKAMLLSGAGMQGNISGFPDIGLTTADDLVRQTEYVCDYSNIPCIVDADDGFGESPLHTYRTAKRLVYAGAAGFSIEDSTGIRGYNRWGKKFETDAEIERPLVSKDVWLSKIKAAVAACEGSECMVIARTETKFTMGLDEAVDRCNRALDLGADMTLVMGLHNLEEAEYVAKRVPGNKMFPDIMSRNGVPYCSLEELDQLGFNFVTCHFLEKGAMMGMHEFAKRVIADRNTVYADTYKIDLDPTKARLFYETEDDAWMTMEKVFMDVSMK